MSILSGRGFAAALLVAGLAGPACAQGSSELSPGELGGNDSGATVDTGSSGEDSSAAHDGGTAHTDASTAADASTANDASVGIDASTMQDTGIPLADASVADTSMRPDASPDTGTVQPDASTAPIQCPNDTIHSAEAVIELAKPMPKTCIVPAQCSPGECCFVPFVCVPL